MQNKVQNIRFLVVFKKSLSLLDPKDRKKLIWITGVQIFLSALDLIGVVIIGLITALAVNAITVGKPGNRLNAVLSFLQLEQISPQLQAVVLGVIATAILVLKTIVSLNLTKKSLIFLNLKAAQLSSQLTKKFLNRPLQDIQQKTMYQSLFDLTTGVQSLANGIIASTLSIIADSALLIVLFLGLFLVDPTMALCALAIFGLTGLILYRLVQVRAHTIGARTAALSVQNNNSIIEIFEGYREAVVRNRRAYYANKIGNERIELAALNAENAFLPQISKYALEITIVISGLFISGLQFLTNDAYRAVGVLSIFMAASSRMGPAVLRIQQSAVTVRTNSGMAQSTLELIEELDGVIELTDIDEVGTEYGKFEYSGFIPEVRIENLTVNYPGKPQSAILGLNMAVKAGSIAAIVGTSGAGKSTLVDCLLGILKPTTGKISISGLDSLQAVRTWPGAIGYVPQDVFISRGTVLENVGLGFDSGYIDRERAIYCLKKVKLFDLIMTFPNGLDENLGDFGSRMSGGQRQRLGIARALFTNPKLLILDEATSALDSKTESEISKAIQDLKGEVTLILVAHRLSTVRFADQVHYLAGGNLKASGTFDEVRAAIPDFDQQAKLMGL